MQILRSARGDRSLELARWLQDYAHRRLNSFLMDERRSIPPHVVLEFAERGLLGLRVPPDLGGLGLSVAETTEVFAQLGAIDLSLASFLGVHNVLGTLPLLNHGVESLRADWLPRLATGRALGAFAITESGAGSNPRALEAAVKPDRDGVLRLSGTKEWIGNGCWAGLITVFAKEWSSNGELLGISAFGVPQDTRGLSHGPEALTMGMRAMVQNRVIFDDVVVGEALRIGRAGDGLNVASETMNFGRLGICAMALGAMRTATQTWGRYALRRSISTGRLLQNEVSLRRLSEATAGIKALELWLETLSRRYDSEGTIPVLLCMMSKVLGPELLGDTVDFAVQGLGGRGYMEPNGLPQLMRDARLLRIFEGPTETLLTAIGAVVADEGERAAFAQSMGSGGVDWGTRLEELVQELRSSTGEDIGHWGLHQLGWAATWMTFESTCRFQSERDSSGEIQRALEWVRLKAQASRRAIQGGGDPLAAIQLDSVDLQGVLERLEEGLPLVEQKAPDEERCPDSILLAPARTHSPRDIVARSTAEEKAASPGQSAFKAERKGEVVQVGGSPPRVEVLENWMLEELGKALRVDPLDLDSEKPFSELGVDSIHALSLIEKLERHLGRSLDATLLWSFPTVAELSEYLVDGTGQEMKVTQRQAAPASLDRLRALLDEGGSDGR